MTAIQREKGHEMDANELTLQTVESTAVLADSDRQPCEVWTRVMGYHRPVASFNTGKKGEFTVTRN